MMELRYLMKEVNMELYTILGPVSFELNLLII